MVVYGFKKFYFEGDDIICEEEDPGQRPEWRYVHYPDHTRWEQHGIFRPENYEKKNLTANLTKDMKPKSRFDTLYSWAVMHIIYLGYDGNIYELRWISLISTLTGWKLSLLVENSGLEPDTFYSEYFKRKRFRLGDRVYKFDVLGG